MISEVACRVVFETRSKKCILICIHRVLSIWVWCSFIAKSRYRKSSFFWNISSFCNSCEFHIFCRAINTSHHLWYAISICNRVSPWTIHRRKNVHVLPIGHKNIPEWSHISDTLCVSRARKVGTTRDPYSWYKYSDDSYSTHDFDHGKSLLR